MLLGRSGCPGWCPAPRRRRTCREFEGSCSLNLELKFVCSGLSMCTRMDVLYMFGRYRDKQGKGIMKFRLQKLLATDGWIHG